MSQRSQTRRALALLVVLVSVPAAAEPGPFARFRGGGSNRTDCMLVTEVAGVAAQPRARTTVCTDGDPACDADGVANNACLFSVRICLDAADQSGCTPEPISHVTLAGPIPALAGLSAAIGAMSMPVDVSETCTASAAVPVATRGRRPGRVALRTTASMGTSGADRDRLVIICRPALSTPLTATFANVQRKVFVRSCATFSCHGAVGAGGLVLTPEAAYANLVGVPPANGSARDAGLLRVAPGDPARSFLLLKLSGPLGPGEGDPMPRVGGTLSPALQDLVRRWIAAGAPANPAP